MTWSDGIVTVHTGDALTQLRALPDESVQCVVTSPPYWGLRDYGTASWAGGDADCDHLREPAHFAGPKQTDQKPSGNASAAERIGGATCPRGCGATRVDSQMGLEPTPEAYVASMVEVFAEVRRVLRRDGTLWLNMGDSYASHDPGGRREGEFLNPGGREAVKTRENGSARNRAGNYRPGGLKSKDLVGMPWRLAFALQADGWYLRCDVIWSKPNPMPESVTDRPTKAHEYLFLLSREPRYFYDQEAVREAWTCDRDDMRTKGVRTGRAYLQSELPIPSNGDGGRRSGWKTPDGWDTSSGEGGHGSVHRNGREKGHKQAATGEAAAILRGGDTYSGFNERWFGEEQRQGRNRRSVWTIATQPYPDAHFATFPEALVAPCILAGTSAVGACPECGAPWERITVPSEGGKRQWHDHDPTERLTKGQTTGGGQKDWSTYTPPRTEGWQATCEHTGATPRPCTVLDPFAGSGTTLAVAKGLDRSAVGIELNPAYVDLIRRRVAQAIPTIALPFEVLSEVAL